MKRIILTVTLLFFSATGIAGDNGVVTIPSNYTVGETMDRVETTAKSHGMNIFARIDFAEMGKKIEMDIPANQLLIFGKGRGGPKLVSAAPAAALDLPLKMAVWEDAGGKVWLSYTSAAYIRDRHDIKGRDKVIGKIDGRLKEIAAEAVK